MGKFEELWAIHRECYLCGETLFYNGFIRTASIMKVEGGFDKKMIEEIWKNPVFCLLCCDCYDLNDLIEYKHHKIRHVLFGFTDDRYKPRLIFDD